MGLLAVARCARARGTCRTATEAGRARGWHDGRPSGQALEIAPIGPMEGADLSLMLAGHAPSLQLSLAGVEGDVELLIQA